MGRRNTRLSDEECGRRACRAFFGCGNGGRDFDEFDPTETYHALTASEREELRFGESPGGGTPSRRALSSKQKKDKKRRQKENKTAQDARWRAENQAKW